MYDLKTILIDSSIAKHIDEEWAEFQLNNSDKRKHKSAQTDYDLWALLWFYLSCEDNRDRRLGKFRVDDFVPVSRDLMTGLLGVKYGKFREIKEKLHKEGWAVWWGRDHVKGDRRLHHMKPIFSGEFVEYKLRNPYKQRTRFSVVQDRVQEDDEACVLTHQAMDLVEVDLDGALAWLSKQREIETRYAQEFKGVEDPLALAVIAEDPKAHNKREKKTKLEYFEWYSQREKQGRNQYESVLFQVATNRGTITRDEFGNRLHSPFARLRRGLRNFVTIGGYKLWSLDICESHPTIIGNWMREDGKEDSGMLEDAKARNFYLSIGERLMEKKPYNTEYIYYKEPYPEEARLNARDRAKGSIQLWLNGRNVRSKKANKERIAIDETMRELYPGAWKWITERKEDLRGRLTDDEVEAGVHEGTCFNRKLQCFESDLWVDTYYTRLVQDHGVAALTCHDAVYCGEQDSGMAKKVLAEVLGDEFDCQTDPPLTR